MSTPARFDQALELFARHGVDFFVAGGVAAILQGSPLTTDDVDLVYRVSEANGRRLEKALVELEAVYLDPAGRTLRPTLDRLLSLDVHLLRTNCGRVDLMARIGAGLGYDDLLARTRLLRVGDVRVAVLALDAVIETKEQADRPKDRFQLPYLRQLMAELKLGREDGEGERS